MTKAEAKQDSLVDDKEELRSSGSEKYEFPNLAPFVVSFRWLVAATVHSSRTLCARDLAGCHTLLNSHLTAMFKGVATVYPTGEHPRVSSDVPSSSEAPALTELTSCTRTSVLIGLQMQNKIMDGLVGSRCVVASLSVSCQNYQLGAYPAKSWSPDHHIERRTSRRWPWQSKGMRTHS